MYGYYPNIKRPWADTQANERPDCMGVVGRAVCYNDLDFRFRGDGLLDCLTRLKRLEA